MKANEAPEKIYIHVRVNKELGTTWHDKKITNSDIEYVCKDAFIEKAETYLKEKFAKDVSVLAGGAVHINFETAINNFIKYMKGE
jgi:hypothetical protein